MKVALLTNIVTPYTHRLFERMGQSLGGDLSVFACSETEPERHWTVAPARYYRRAALGACACTGPTSATSTSTRASCRPCWGRATTWSSSATSRRR